MNQVCQRCGGRENSILHDVKCGSLPFDSIPESDEEYKRKWAELRYVRFDDKGDPIPSEIRQELCRFCNQPMELVSQGGDYRWCSKRQGGYCQPLPSTNEPEVFECKKHRGRLHGCDDCLAEIIIVKDTEIRSLREKLEIAITALQDISNIYPTLKSKTAKIIWKALLDILK